MIFTLATGADKKFHAVALRANRKYSNNVTIQIQRFICGAEVALPVPFVYVIFAII